MIGSVEVVTPPSQEPLTLAQAKEHLRIVSTDQDALITSLISAARGTIERRCARALLSQVWALHLDEFPDEIELPGGFVISVDEISYLDADGARQTLDEADYHAHLAGNPPTIEPIDSWPETKARRGAVTVTFTCGWADVTDLPPDLVHAAKLLVANYYSQPEPVNVGNITSELPWGVGVLIKLWDLTRQIG